MNFNIQKTCRYLAPAKINLHLNVTDTLADGRHALDTSFVFVDCYDTLHIKECASLTVHCSIPELSGEQNLVFKILKSFQEKYNIQQGLDVSIDKHIPSEAGLGGGSSDAATALMAANILWGIKLSTEELISFATPFGADIPCFLFGKASIAQGVGEQLSPYNETLPGKYICLAKPYHGLSTKRVFQQFDRMLNTQNTCTSDIPQQSPLTHSISADKMRAASQGKLAIGENALQKSAIALLPEISLLLQAMQRKADLVWMSGSGSTCVALCSSSHDAKQLKNDLQQSGKASWTHAGVLLSQHPAFEDNNGA